MRLEVDLQKRAGVGLDFEIKIKRMQILKIFKPMIFVLQSGLDTNFANIRLAGKHVFHKR